MPNYFFNYLLEMPNFMEIITTVLELIWQQDA
jgi:hypothetical protein